jgi:DNA-binding MarR family transcriptional regulator
MSDLNRMMSEPQPNVVAQVVIRTIPTVMRVVTAELRRQDIPLLPAQLGVLVALSVQSCNLSELAEHSGVSLPTMSGTISHLVGQGWVQRTRSPNDRRMILLELTEDGRTLLNHLLQQIIAHIADLLTPLSPAELADIQNGLVTIQKVFPPLETNRD